MRTLLVITKFVRVKECDALREAYNQVIDAGLATPYHNTLAYASGERNCARRIPTLACTVKLLKKQDKKSHAMAW
jgi:hypothetical protein